MAATLKSRIPEIAVELVGRMDIAAKASAELVEARAKARAPDAPPFGEGLVAAIHVGREGPAAYSVVAGDSDVFYGHMVEFGTSHSAPHPFLLPALEESTADILELFAIALRGL